MLGLLNPNTQLGSQRDPEKSKLSQNLNKREKAEGFEELIVPARRLSPGCH